MRYVALLRGINVGGKKKVPMADLRSLMSGLGHHDVTTILQSGNAVFSSSRRGAGAIARELEAAIAEQMHVECRVFVRTAAELSAVVETNPMADAVADPARFHCCFLEKTASNDKVAALLAEAASGAFDPDELAFGDGVLYAWYRAGVQHSKLATVLDRRLGVAVTARNWNTVTKLVELASD